MKKEIVVPRMGESITEATVGSILKPAGSQVSEDDEILELETDKVNQVVYAEANGILNLNVAPHQVVKIGEVLGSIDTEGKKEEVRETPKSSEEKKEAPAKPVEEKKEIPSKPTEEKKEAPAKPAEEKVEIKKEEATAKPVAEEKESAPTKSSEEKKEAPAKPVEEKKEIPSKPTEEKKDAPAKPTEEKVEIKKEEATAKPVAEEKESAPTKSSEEKKERETRKKLPKIRQVIAERMVEAKSQTAMLTTFNEVDMTQVLTLREKYQEAFSKQYGVRLGLLSFFIKAVVSALQETPALNAYLEVDEIVYREYYDIGVAVATDRGVIVPVIRGCDTLTFAEMEKALQDFALKARDGTISVDDLQGGGFTITNGGVYGSLFSTPILNFPQTGILGMHKIVKRPISIEDQVVIRPMMYLALTYDHRIIDGKDAVLFLVHVKNYLEDPTRILIGI